MEANGDAKMREACGVMACVLAENVSVTDVNIANTIRLGLTALQHRGQEGAGIVTSEGKGTKEFHQHKGQGLVSNVFSEEALTKLTGVIGLGHTRYSTTGGGAAINTQPFVVHSKHGPIAVAHNGQLINADSLRTWVLEKGIGLSTCSDSEIITQILCSTPPRVEKNGADWAARIRHLVEASPLAYSLALMVDDKLYAVRDPFGNRPLCLGKLVPLHNTPEFSDDDADSGPALGWIISSESCVFQSIGAVMVREVMPGEIVEVSPQGIQTLDVVPRPRPRVCDNKNGSNSRIEGWVNPLPAFCIFEYVYFARTDSIFENQQVYSVRMRCGMQLAEEAYVDADIVSSIPESATPAALGYAKKSGIPFVEVLSKNRYVGRSFILPDTRLRQLEIAKKFGALTENIKDKKVVLVDDSIVRGNTVMKIIKLIKSAGAKEVHLRIASPPIKYPCYMGINIPTKDELIANKTEPDKLAEFVGADTLIYLSIEGLVKAVQKEAQPTSPKEAVGHCTACLDSKYPEW